MKPVLRWLWSVCQWSVFATLYETETHRTMQWWSPRVRAYPPHNPLSIGPVLLVSAGAEKQTPLTFTVAWMWDWPLRSMALNCILTPFECKCEFKPKNGPPSLCHNAAPHTTTIRHLMTLKLQKHYKYIHLQPQDVLKPWKAWKLTARITSDSFLETIEHITITLIAKRDWNKELQNNTQICSCKSHTTHNSFWSLP